MNIEELEFDPSVKAPSLPIKEFGQFWYCGWDIDTKWAIDSAGVCWCDNGEGYLKPVSRDELIAMTHDGRRDEMLREKERISTLCAELKTSELKKAGYLKR